MTKCKYNFDYDPHCHNCGVCLRNAIVKHIRVGKYSCGKKECEIITDYDLKIIAKGRKYR